MHGFEEVQEGFPTCTESGLFNKLGIIDFNRAKVFFFSIVQVNITIFSTVFCMVQFPECLTSSLLFPGCLFTFHCTFLLDVNDCSQEKRLM